MTVTVTFLHTRPRIGDTRQAVTVRQGELLGSVPFEPSLMRVRIAGQVHRVPREYITERTD